MESWFQRVGLVLAGGEQIEGMVRRRNLQPHPQCSSIPAKGIRAGLEVFQPLLGTGKRRGTEMGTQTGGKSLVCESGEQRSAKEQLLSSISPPPPLPANPELLLFLIFMHTLVCYNRERSSLLDI